MWQKLKVYYVGILWVTCDQWKFNALYVNVYINRHSMKCIGVYVQFIEWRNYIS